MENHQFFIGKSTYVYGPSIPWLTTRALQRRKSANAPAGWRTATWVAAMPVIRWLNYSYYGSIPTICIYIFFLNIYIYTSTYIPTYLPTYLHIYLHACMYTCIYIYIHTSTYIHTYIPTYLPTYIPTYLPTCMHIYMHTHTHIYIYICIYIYTCTTLYDTTSEASCVDELF